MKKLLCYLFGHKYIYHWLDAHSEEVHTIETNTCIRCKKTKIDLIIESMCREHYFGVWPNGNPCSVCDVRHHFDK